MDTTIANTLVASLCGFAGGLISIIFNSLLSAQLKDRELEISHRHRLNEMKQELLLKHKYEKVNGNCSNFPTCGIIEVREKVARLESFLP